MYVILEGLHTSMSTFGASEVFDPIVTGVSPYPRLGHANIRYVSLWADCEESTNVETALQGGDRTNPHLTSSDVIHVNVRRELFVVQQKTRATSHVTRPRWTTEHEF